MGIGPGTTRITNIANWTDSKVLFSNPDWQGDNAMMNEGVHDFPFGHPPSVPWAWENSMSFLSPEGKLFGSVWRDGWDMFYKAGTPPTSKRDGNHIFTHTQPLLEEYVVLGLSTDRCGVLSTQTQLDAIWNNVSRGALQAFDALGISGILQFPKGIMKFGQDLENAFRGNPEAAKDLATVSAQQWTDALAAVPDEEYAKVRSGDENATKTVLGAIVVGLGAVGGVFAAIAGAAGVVAAIAAALTLPTMGTAGWVAVIAGVLCGVMTIVGGGLGSIAAILGGIILAM